MENSSRFKEHMQKSVIKKIFAIIIVGAILFILGLLLVTYTTNEINTANNLNKIKEDFISLYKHNEEYLLSDTTMQICKDILLNNEDSFKIENSLRHLNMEREVQNEAILCDAYWNILYTSYSENELSSYLHNYNSAICNNARNCSEDEIYNAVFFESEKYSDYMFVKPVLHNGNIIGYLSLYLLGSDWSYYMSELNFDGVITDERNNVIFFNRSSLITNNYRFEVEKSKVCFVGKERFWLGYEYLPEYGVTIYSLVYYPENFVFLIGITVIVIIGFLWYRLAKQMASSMAEKNAASINKLVSEIRIIRKQNPQHRVIMDSGDEFEDVAYQINYMLDNINILNNKNTELLRLNNTIEMNQLTAQINPHFLYNTLELIRNLVLLDGEKAAELIVRLTQVLRYSINNSKRDVRLEEDMEYISDYLSIQKCRFGDSFECNIEIDKECGKCVVPKLLLQPIIENSIKYGFKKKMKISIDIRGYVENHTLYLRVKDDCMGMPREDAQKLNDSLKKIDNDTESNGLHNIARRLFLQYGEKSGLEIINEEGAGFEVLLKIAQKE